MPRPNPLALLSICAAAMATPSGAQSYDVVLGGRTLGQIALRDAGSQQRLQANLNNTPFGVFDGSFVATSSDAQAPHVYTGISRSTRKSRDITTIASGGRIIETRIAPHDERTAMSDPEAVPKGVLDPVEAFAAFASTSECPAALRFYDGRRVIGITPEKRMTEGEAVTCSYAYRVEAGPGHLSPLRISSFTLHATYAPAGASRGLASLAVKTGPFSLRIER
ncbi:hypothetical protein [Profundibacterium mesophilum]|nr:hypothetical protein [Profundibacterium mesophilum]